MKNFALFLSMILIGISCGSDELIIESDPNHYGLEAIYDHLPFDQFNENSHAVFKDAAGEEFKFSLSINEETSDALIDDKMESFSQITFLYRSDDIFDIPSLQAIAVIRDLPERGYTELILCGISDIFSSFQQNNLEILPGENYNTTILNETFEWMDKPFENTYSNILIEENPINNVKLFYQVGNGIIGFTDGSGKSWVFDRFE